MNKSLFIYRMCVCTSSKQLGNVLHQSANALARKMMEEMNVERELTLTVRRPARLGRM